nr:MAG TPA: hypothetical protein [Caudoviricetes sp.]
MTLYKIYFIMKGKIEESDPTLYAFTNKKTLASKFIDERSKKLYRLIEQPNGDETYEKLNHQFPLMKLKDIPLKAFSRDDWDMHDVILVGTYREEKEIEALIENFIFTFKKDFRVDPKIFKKEYRDALAILCYTGFHNWAEYEETLPFRLNYADNSSVRKFAKSYRYDEFELFGALYGASLRKQD